MEELEQVFGMEDASNFILHSDYKTRMKGEYIELAIRTQKLENMCVKYSANALDFNPSCPLELLENQLGVMKQYLYILKIRFAIEGIEIPKVEL